MKRASRYHLVQHPCSSRTASRLLNTSKDENPSPLWATYSVTLRVKKYFLMFRQHLLCFSMCPLPLSLGITGKSLAPPYFHHPFRYLWILIGLFFPRLSQPFRIGEMLQSLQLPHGPLLDCLLHVLVSLVLRSSELDSALQVWPHQC